MKRGLFVGDKELVLTLSDVMTSCKGSREHGRIAAAHSQVPAVMLEMIPSPWDYSVLSPVVREITLS